MSDLRLAQDKQASDTEQLARKRENLAGHHARLTQERGEIGRLEAAVADSLRAAPERAGQSGGGADRARPVRHVVARAGREGA